MMMIIMMIIITCIITTVINNDGKIISHVGKIINNNDNNINNNNSYYNIKVKNAVSNCAAANCRSPFTYFPVYPASMFWYPVATSGILPGYVL